MGSNRLKLLLLSMMAVFAIGAVASASASAAARCYMVAEKETGRFASSLTCEAGTPVIAKGEWINVKKVEPPFAPGVACAMVETAKTGKYSNAACTEEKSGATEKEFIKVKVSQDIWQECANVGAGKGKFTTNKCSAEGAPKEFEWIEIAAAKPVTSSGGTFTLTAGGKTVTCTKVTDKGTVGPGAADFAEEIKFENCTTGTTGCLPANKGGTAGTVVVTNISTKLEQVVIGEEEILVDTFFQKTVGTTKEFVTLTFTGATCAAAGYVETKVKGDVAAETTNEANGEVKLTFPKTAITVPTKLEAFGVGATLTGTDNEKLTSGAGLRAV